MNVLYLEYGQLKKRLKKKKVDNPKIGQVNDGFFYSPLFLDDKMEWICYETYKTEGKKTKLIDSGEICMVDQMPKTEEEFWEIVKNGVNLSRW